MQTAVATRRARIAAPQRFGWALRPLLLWAAWRVLHLAAVLAVGGRPERWWDDGYYRTILRQGYRPLAEYGVHQQTNFFPLLPWITRAVQVVVRSETLAMNVVVTVAQVAAVLLVYRAARRWTGERVALWAVALFLLVPASVFLWMFFTEGLFIALVIGAILAAEDDRPALAGLLGVGVAATRSMGVLVALPLAIAALQHRRALDRRLLWSALPALGTAAVMVAQWIQAGDPLDFVSVSGERNTSLQFPLTTFFERIDFAFQIGLTTGALVDVAAVLATTALGVVAFRSRLLPWSVQAWLWLAMLTPLTSGLPFSWSRYMFAAWPAFIVAAHLLVRRPVLTRVIVAVLLAALTLDRLVVWHDGLFIG